jgi:hypothetical protein
MSPIKPKKIAIAKKQHEVMIGYINREMKKEA